MYTPTQNYYPIPQSSFIFTDIIALINNNFCYLNRKNIQSNLVNKFNQDFSDLENSRANSLQHLRNLYKEFEETRFILRNDILAQQSNEQMAKLNPHDKHKLIEELCSRPNTPNESVKNQNSFENFSILQKINQYNEHWLMNSVKLLKEINDPVCFSLSLNCAVRQCGNACCAILLVLSILCTVVCDNYSEIERFIAKIENLNFFEENIESA